MSDSTSDRPAIGMPCPRCRVDLVMSDRQGIEIDYCPQCRGVWLDRGELDKIIERNAQFLPPAAPVGAAPQSSAAAPGSPWVAPVQPAPGYAMPAPPPPGWGQGYDQHGGSGGHGSGHGRGHGGARDGHGNSFLGRLFR